MELENSMPQILHSFASKLWPCLFLKCSNKYFLLNVIVMPQTLQLFNLWTSFVCIPRSRLHLNAFVIVQSVHLKGFSLSWILRLWSFPGILPSGMSRETADWNIMEKF
jgi:hypothetical protein